MKNYNINQLKNGLKIILSGDPFEIIEDEFVKPGKGIGFNRVKLKNLQNNKIIEKIFKSNETIKSADIKEISVQLLYNNKDIFYFMNNENYEQYNINKNLIEEEKLQWLIEQKHYNILLWDNKPIKIIIPKFIETEIIDIDPSIKSESITATKYATIKNGYKIKVPLFIQINHIIKIDTRSNLYVSKI